MERRLGANSPIQALTSSHGFSEVYPAAPPLRPPLPPLWPDLPSTAFPPWLPPRPSPAPKVSAAVASLLDKSICVLIVLARYEMTSTSCAWLLLIGSARVATKYREPHKSLSIFSGSTLGARANALRRNCPSAVLGGVSSSMTAST